PRPPAPSAPAAWSARSPRSARPAVPRWAAAAGPAASGRGSRRAATATPGTRAATCDSGRSNQGRRKSRDHPYRSGTLSAIRVRRSRVLRRTRSPGSLDAEVPFEGVPHVVVVLLEVLRARRLRGERQRPAGLEHEGQPVVDLL